MELTWLGQAEARGEERGLERGIQKGLAQAVEQMRRAVLQHVEHRFGALPERVQKRVQAIDSLDPLAELLAKIPLVQSADELVSGG